MNRLLALAFASGLLLCAGRGSAQDALGGTAFDDEWDAILKLAPPNNAAAASDGSESKATRGGEATNERGRSKDREPSSERKKERAASDPARAAKTEKDDGEVRVTSRSTKPERRGREEDSDEKPARESGKDAKRREDAKGGDSAEVQASGEGYDGLVRAWHEPWPAHAGDQAIDLLAGAPPVLSLHPVGKVTTPYVLLPNGKDGGFNEAQVAVASQAFGNWPGGPQVSPRLLDLIYHAAQHFKVFHVHLVSGIRNDRSGSRHSHGLAADIVLPGVSDEELAAYFRPQGFLGVGIYTRAGFVHVDVREKSYFWLDKSPPNKRLKIIQVRADEARMADEAAILRGQTGYVNPPRLQKALHARAKRRMEKARASQ